MIKKDESVYLNYIKEIENKIDKIYKNVASITMSDSARQDIDNIRVKIFGKMSTVRMLAGQKTGLIPHTDWVGYQAEINMLYRQLADKIDQAIVRSSRITANTR